jgi:hypothetical protein
MLDAASVKNLRLSSKYCAGGQKRFRGAAKGAKMTYLGPCFTGYHLSDYFGTPFAKFRLSCNSLKNLY